MLGSQEKILENLIIISKVGGKLWRREGYMEQYLSDRNQLQLRLSEMVQNETYR